MEKINMKAVIFAGGIGTRMWPLSRKKTPKQFEKIIDNESTLQLAVKHLRPEFSYKNIYVSTNNKYKSIVIDQLLNIPSKNIIGEPERRDLAPAVGYLCMILAKENPDEPFVILWSDHLKRKLNNFKNALKAGLDLVTEDPKRFIFIGEKPQFANENLGWIRVGKKIKETRGIKVYEHKSWHYHPSREQAEKYFRDKHWFWNPGYWVVTPRFVLEQYQRFLPKMYQSLLKLQQSYGTKNHQQDLKKIYPTLEKISFDDAILEKVEPEKAVLLGCDLGWADIGTWEALKEVLQKNPQQNLIKGNVYLYKCKDLMVYNYSPQLVTAINLKGMVIVNTGDVILVCPEASMKEIKKVVEQFEGTEKESYT